MPAAGSPQPLDAPPAFARGSELVEAAWRLALEAYRAQADGDPVAGVEHPAIVARLVHDAGGDEGAVATAVLHDTIEDTGLDPAAIAARCGPEVARRVTALTEDRSISSYAQRKAEQRARGIAAGREAAVVMAADKLARATRASGGRMAPEKLRHYRATLAELRAAHPDLPLLDPLETAIAQLRPEAASPEGAPAGDAALFVNRELSWLDFNERVLELAEDPERPLLERVKFCSIFSSNLDEFFMVRVAGVHDQVDAGVEATSADGVPPGELLDRIGARVRELAARQARCWEGSLRPALAEHGIRVVAPGALDPQEREQLRERFGREVFPALTPLAVGPAQPFPYISNLSLSLGVLVCDPDSGQTRFARVKVPKEGLPRLIELPGRAFVPLEAVIAEHLDRLFRGMEIVAQTAFRVTRDADFTVSDEADDLLQAVQEQLRRRRMGEVVRLEVGAGVDPVLREHLIAGLGIEERDVYEVDGLLDLADLGQLVKLPALRELRDPPWTPVVPPEFVSGGEARDLFAQLCRGDLLVHHPYDSFATVEQFVGQAVADPDVLAIKQTVYRTSDDSPLVPTLIRAAERGKQVVCLLELTARFDERANIAWARALEQAGVHVTYGMPGLKTHAKAILVVRREGGGVRHYAHVGTGNYHGGTADLYTDFGLFTADDRLTGEIAELFNQLTGFSRLEHHRRVLVAPLNLRERMIEEIEATIDAHEAGKPARIAMKMNSLVDAACIRALYRASQAGVRVDLNVRGACCLRPGVSGVSESIRVVSIVGRFLEHSRIYAFERGEETAVFVGSADLMPRNLDSRVELVVPVEDPGARAQLLDALERCLADTANAWELGTDGGWVHRRTPAGGERRDVHAELMAAHLARAAHADG